MILRWRIVYAFAIVLKINPVLVRYVQSRIAAVFEVQVEPLASLHMRDVRYIWEAPHKPLVHFHVVEIDHCDNQCGCSVHDNTLTARRGPSGSS